MKKLILGLCLFTLIPVGLSASDSQPATAATNSSASNAGINSSVQTYSTPNPRKFRQLIQDKVYAYKSLKKSVQQDYASLTSAGANAIQKVIQLNKTGIAPSKKDNLQAQLAKQDLAYVRLLSTINGVCAMIPNAKEQIDVCKLVEI